MTLFDSSEKILSAKEAVEKAKSRIPYSRWLELFMCEISRRAWEGRYYMAFGSDDFNESQKIMLGVMLSVQGYNYEFNGEGTWSLVCWGITQKEARNHFLIELKKGYEPRQPWIEYLNK